MGCSHAKCLESYHTLQLKRNKLDCVKSGRSSGGLCIWYKHNLHNDVTVIKKSKNYIWFRMGQTVSASVLVCCIYIPPDGSPYYDDELFDELDSDIMNYNNNSNGKLLLISDFNSRTGSLSDFIEAHIDDHMLSHSIALSITSKRKFFDGSTNKNSKRLIKLCKSKQLSILNGRKEGDTLGMFTFISNKGEASTVDYSIVSESLFLDIPYFIVNPHNYLSNHSQISLWIRSDDYFLKPQSDMVILL